MSPDRLGVTGAIPSPRADRGLNLVNRLAQKCKSQGKSLHFMAPTLIMCSTMFRTDPQHLCWVLEKLAAGHVVNRVSVPAEQAELAKKSLDNMLLAC